MDKDFPYVNFINIMKECRETIINDTLNENSPDLYDALYSDVHSEIFEVKLELYELKWIWMHWKKAICCLENKELSNSDRREIISLFAKWYNSFISNWNYSDSDFLIFDKKISILQTIISSNYDWEQNIKKLENSFIQSQKILNKKINSLKGGC